MRWILNKHQTTFIKYLPCARLWTKYTKTKRHGPCPQGAHSLIEADIVTNTMAKHQESIMEEGIILPGG